MSIIVCFIVLSEYKLRVWNAPVYPLRLRFEFSTLICFMCEINTPRPKTAIPGIPAPNFVKRRPIFKILSPTDVHISSGNFLATK